jgi:hypothetical protein
MPTPQLEIVIPATEPDMITEVVDFHVPRGAIEQDISIVLSPIISVVL